MTSAEHKIIHFISENNLIESGDRILCALSGGPDSIFLLTFLYKFRRKYRSSVAAFHLNHMLRGRAADRDEKFCRNFCKEKGIPLFSSKADIKSEAARSKISVEEAGRNARYELLKLTARQNGFTKIATGHNNDDNSETVLLNLIKGAGIRGIAGIPVRRGNIIRPLLGISKTEITQYLDENHILYVADRSNLSSDYERNFLRNKILPLIRNKLNPSLDEAVLRSSFIFRNILSLIDRKTDEAVVKVMEKGESIRINITKLQQQDPELQTEIIRKILERNFTASPSFKDITSVISLLDRKTGTKIQLPGKLNVVRERTYLAVAENSVVSAVPVKISTGHSCKLDGKELRIDEWKKKPVFSSDGSIEYIDGGNSGDEFVIRPWRPGDKFIPFGMKGTVKVSDFLNSVKVPSSVKKSSLVLTNKGGIVWIIGYRIDDRFKISPETKRILKLWMK